MLLFINKAEGDGLVFKRSVSVFLCVMMIITLFPVGAVAADVQQNLPINDGMESAVQVNQSILTNMGLTGKAALTQDRVEGKYAVKVTIGDVPNQNFANYTLASSGSFEVNRYGQIKVWVKPGAEHSGLNFSLIVFLLKMTRTATEYSKLGKIWSADNGMR